METIAILSSDEDENVNTAGPSNAAAVHPDQESRDAAYTFPMKASQKEMDHDLKKDKHGVGSNSQLSTPSTSTGLRIIMVYPPPPAVGGISINTEDYSRLSRERFLSDAIIDFYLKYLWLNMLNEEDRNRTFIFSSFFYKRLRSPRLQANSQENQNLSLAEKRHANVKGWTKKVDIFEKDFIVIPINKRSHWFLGIICFPGLNGPVRMADNQAVPNIVRKRCTVVAKDETITQAPTISLVDTSEDHDEDSDKNEAEADDDDMEPNASDEESGKDDLMDEATPKKSCKIEMECDPIKQPCILIFDSLGCSNKSRVCATLREYLEIEWKIKHEGIPRDFSKEVFKGAEPIVPMQTNLIDCGAYVLQYAEAFFMNPIKDYRLPLLNLKNWFTTEEVDRKRYEIKELIMSLMRDQNIDIDSLNLPNLNLEYGDEEEVVEEGEFDDDDEELAFEGDKEDPVGEDEYEEDYRLEEEEPGSEETEGPGSEGEEPRSEDAEEPVSEETEDPASEEAEEPGSEEDEDPLCEENREDPDFEEEDKDEPIFIEDENEESQQEEPISVEEEDESQLEEVPLYKDHKEGLGCEKEEKGKPLEDEDEENSGFIKQPKPPGEKDNEEHTKLEDINNKDKCYAQYSRLEQPLVNLEAQPQLDKSPRSEVTSFGLGTSKQLENEALKDKTIKSRISEQVTTGEAGTKRKSPVSLKYKDVRKKPKTSFSTTN